MAEFVFPTSDLDVPSALRGTVGGFWSDVYGGHELVESLLMGRARLEAQSHADLLELVASISRFKVPVLHGDNWYAHRMRESAMNQTNLARFDGAYSFDGQIQFDEPVTRPGSAWASPAGLVEVAAVTTRLLADEGGVTWLPGVDFVLEAAAGRIVFRNNPFDAPFRADIVEIFEDGVRVDRELTLWLYRAGFDRESVHTQFGYVLGPHRAVPTVAYRDLVNAVCDALVGGTGAGALAGLLSAVTGVPLAARDGTVENVFASPGDSPRLWVVTGEDAYEFAAGAVPLVAVGDTVVAGQALTDVLQVLEFGRGEAPPALLRALSLGRGYVGAGFLSELVFENKIVPLIVEENVDGYTKVSFEVGGFPGDVTAFWAQTHAAGVAAGQTLAMRMDARADPTTQPTVAVLPATVNPLGFLVKNVFRNNLFVVFVRPAAFGARALGLAYARFLRMLVPPHTSLVLVVRLDAPADEIIMEGPGDASTTGYEEEVTTFQGKSFYDEVDAGNYLTERVRLTLVGGRCV